MVHFSHHFPASTMCCLQKWGLAAGLRNRSRSFFDEVGVGFLKTPGVGVGNFCPTLTLDVHLDNFLHHTLKLGIPIEMAKFFLKLLLKPRFLAVHHDFHWSQQPNFIPLMLRSRSGKS